MIAAVFVTLAALTLSPTPPGARHAPVPAATGSNRTAATSSGRAAATGSGGAATTGSGRAATSELPAPQPPRADELYSLRARRRLASYLRLRLQELRLEHLDRAADAIERRIPIDELVPVASPTYPASSARSASPATPINPDLPSP